MLNLLHIFFYFNEYFNIYLKSENVLDNVRMSFDEKLKLFLQDKKSIGSKDRKLLSNLIYFYYRNSKYINYLTIEFENKIKTNIAFIQFIEIEKLSLIHRFYLVVYLYNENTNEIDNLESIYTFFDFYIYFKNILIKYLNIDDNQSISIIEYIIVYTKYLIINFDTQIENLNIDTENVLDKFVKYLSIKFTFNTTNIVEILKSFYNLSDLELIKSNIFFNFSTQNYLVQNLLNNLNQRAELYIRIVGKLEEVKKELNDNKISFNSTMFDNLTNTLTITNNSNLTQLKTFRKGFFEIQDLSSQLIFQFIKQYLIERNNEKIQILDYCAGGGGKSLLFSDEIFNVNQNYNIISTDINSDRLKGLKERVNKNKNIKRNITVIEKNIFNQIKSDKFNHAFDIIVIDAPCSGIGTSKRDPEAKFRYKLKDIENFSKIQQEIIGEVLPFLKENGIILYITCSLNYTENQNTIIKVKDNLNLQVINFENYMSQEFLDNVNNSTEINNINKIKFNTEIKSELGVVILPTYFNSDGFFVTILKTQQ